MSSLAEPSCALVGILEVRRKLKSWFSSKIHQVAHDEHRQLSQAAGGLHIEGFLMSHTETATATHEVTELGPLIYPKQAS